VVERRWVGGSCPNINCLPNKNEIWSAKVTDLVQHAAAYGAATDLVSVDMATVRQRKRATWSNTWGAPRVFVGAFVLVRVVFGCAGGCSAFRG